MVIPFFGVLVCSEEATLPRHWRFTGLWKDSFKVPGPIPQLSNMDTEEIISWSWSYREWMPTRQKRSMKSHLATQGFFLYGQLDHEISPFKWWNWRALDKHILPTLVSKTWRLRHLKGENIARINSNLKDKHIKALTSQLQRFKNIQRHIRSSYLNKFVESYRLTFRIRTE